MTPERAGAPLRMEDMAKPSGEEQKGANVGDKCPLGPARRDELELELRGGVCICAPLLVWLARSVFCSRVQCDPDERCLTEGQLGSYEGRDVVSKETWTHGSPI